jgi:hypothetical protein
MKFLSVQRGRPVLPSLGKPLVKSSKLGNNAGIVFQSLERMKT